ncbi:MAG: hypothetical protein DYH03_18910 [Nitrospira sp. NTP1]|nr:hypothetical protein [Nitrospira sp. NTP1]
MNVLLLYPTWTGAYGLFGHFARRNSTWPPLNLALLAAIAERHGHNVTILDGESEQVPLEEMVQRAVAMKPDLRRGWPSYHHHEGAGAARLL